MRRETHEIDVSVVVLGLKCDTIRRRVEERRALESERKPCEKEDQEEKREGMRLLEEKDERDERDEVRVSEIDTTCTLSLASAYGL